MPPIHLLIKPASGMCNMRCQYCFYADIAENRSCASYGMMEESTIEQVIKKSLAAADRECHIAFQGGEPTLRGLDFFKAVIALQEKYNVKNLKIHNSIQTNGYRLGEEWAKFFAEHNFLVGLSIDGTRELHDLLRKDAAGNGTFQEILKTAKLFEKHGVSYNILTVVNSQTARKAESIYRFYKRNKFQYLQFIPCLNPIGIDGNAQGKKPFPYSLTAKAYGEFLCRLFDVWYQDMLKGDAVPILQFENYVQMLMGYPAQTCGMSGICSYQHVVEANGDVYPCDFYVLDQYKLGNLNDCGFDEIQLRRKELLFVEESYQLPQSCRNCKFYPICRGGCKRYRTLPMEGQPNKNSLCDGYYAFFNHAMDRLVQLARHFSQQIR